MRVQVCYSHIHLAQVAVAVLDDACVLGAVKHGDRPSVALHPYAVVGWVHRHGHDVHAQMAHEYDASTLTHSSGVTH